MKQKALCNILIFNRSAYHTEIIFAREKCNSNIANSDSYYIFGQTLVSGLTAVLTTGGIIGIVFHFATITIYLIFTLHARTSDHSITSFFSVAWQNCSFDVTLGAIKGISPFICLSILIISLIFHPLITIFFLFVIISITSIVVILKKKGYDLPFDHLYSAWIGKSKPHQPDLPTRPKQSKVNGRNENQSLIGLIMLIILGGFYLLAIWIEKNSGIYIGRVFVTITVLFVVLIFFYFINMIIRELIKRMYWYRQIFPPGDFAPEEWKVLIKKAKVAKQKELLIRTTHQTLGLNAEDFLEILKEIRKDIKKGPALSTYWDKRDQIEQVLKQEKRG